MTIRIHESVASLPAVSEGNGIFDVTVIRPGWGSSGYYSDEMLQEFGPRVFTKNRPLFGNHPTLEELENGRDMTKIMAKVHETARWEDGVLKAKIKVGTPYREFVEEYMETIGLSIFAEGDGRDGEINGRKGFIVESLNPNDPYASIDFVVAAGAGGKVNEKLMESFRAAEREASGTAGEQPQGTEKKGILNMEKEEFVGIFAEFKTDLVSAIAEALKPSEDVRDALDMAAVAEAARDLPEDMRQEVYASVEGKTQTEALAIVKSRTDLVESVKKALGETTKTVVTPPAGFVAGEAADADADKFSMTRIGEKA